MIFALCGALETRAFAQPLSQEQLLVDAPELHQSIGYRDEAIAVTPSQNLEPLLPETPKEPPPPLSLEINLPRFRQRAPINLIWNQNMISPLSVGQTPTLNAEISPFIEGRWRWQGVRSAVFEPKESWAKSTRYTLHIKGPMEAISGAKIGSLYEDIQSFSTTTNSLRYFEYYRLDEHGVRFESRYFDQANILKACFDQALPPEVDLKLFELWQITEKIQQRSGEESENYLERIGLSLITNLHTKERAHCLEFKVEGEVLPYSTYRFKVLAGLPSLEGPLLSVEEESRVLKSVPRLQISSVNLYRDELIIRFNMDCSTKQVSPHIALLPKGVNPNELSSDQLKGLNLVDTSTDLSPSADSRVHLLHHQDIRQPSVLWIRASSIEKLDGNQLDRADLHKHIAARFGHTKGYPDRGEVWVEYGSLSIDLGEIEAVELPDLITVESLNHPAAEVYYYGVDELCLRWQAITPDELAKNDAVRLNHFKTHLPLVTPDLCVNLFDPTYQHRIAHAPLSPYRLALRGSPETWSFETTSTSSPPSGGTPSATPRSPSPIAQPPHQALKSTQDSCFLRNIDCDYPIKQWMSFEAWSAQQPTLKSGSGPHFYLLTQRWKWNPKSEEISSAYGWSGQKGSTQFKTSQSLVQITRLGMIAKLYHEGGQVWVWDFLSKSLVTQAKVSLYETGGVELATAQTDAHGIARFRLPLDLKKKSYYLVVEHQGEYAFVTSKNTHHVSTHSGRYELDIPWRDERGLLWTERGIYRPEERIYFGATLAVATPKGLTLLRETSCRLVIEDPHGKELGQQMITTSSLGNLTGDFLIPAETGIGSATLTLTCLHQGDRFSWETRPKIGEFRRPTFAVDAHSSHAQVHSGQELQFKLQGRHLYGAPMREARWGVWIENQELTFSPRGRFTYHRPADPPDTQLGSLELSEFEFGLHSWDSDWDMEQSPSIHSTLSERYPTLELTSDFTLNAEEAQSGSLDFEGQTELKLHPEVRGPAPHQLTATWTVTDASDQAMSASSRTVIHPTEGYVGLKLVGSTYQSSQEDNALEVIWVDALQPQPKEGHLVSLDLYHVIWRHTTIKDEVGRDQIESRRELEKLSRCEVVTQSSPQRCAVSSSVLGSRTGSFIWIARSSSSQGGESYTSLRFYRYGDEGGATWYRSSDRQVKVHLTSLKPEVGAQLGVLIESPFPKAEAWITVERERVMYSERKEIGASTMIWIPISDEMGPNAWVNVVVTRPRVRLPYQGYRDEEAFKEWASLQPTWSYFQRYQHQPLASDLGRPLELYGSAPFKVPMSSAQLKVTLTPDHKEKRPGDPIEIKAQVADIHGDPVSGELYLWGVDQGVARLTGYTPPEIASHLHIARDAQVSTFSHLTHLRSHLTLGDKGIPVGGGGMENEDDGVRTRSKKEITPFFVGKAIIGPTGEVTLNQTLPDDLTTFNLYAVALSEKPPQGERPSLLRSGNATSEVTVNLPLMIRPALPRAVTVGDRLLLGAVISSLKTEPVDVEVIFELNDPAQPLAQSSLKTRIPAQGSEVVRLPYEIRALGQLSGRVVLRHQGHTVDASQFSLKVNPPALPERFRQSGELVAQPPLPDQPAPQALVDLRGPSHDQGIPQATPVPKIPSEVSVRLGISVLSGLFSEARGLLEYPYGCLEQRSSRLLPFALLPYFGDQLTTEIKIEGEHPSLSVDEMIRAQLVTLGDMQAESGGLRYWSSPQASVHQWASAYAYITLNELKRAGHSLTPIRIDALRAFLRRATLSQTPTRQSVKVSTHVAALIAFALSEYDHPHAGLEEQLLERRDDLDASELLLLASALAGPLNGEHEEARRSLAQTLLETALNQFTFDGDRLLSPPTYGYRWRYFDSGKRRVALALLALLRVDPEDARALSLLRSLTFDRQDPTPLTTQESAFALLALRDYVKVREAVPPQLTASVDMILNTSGFSPLGQTTFSHKLDGPAKHTAKVIFANDPEMDKALRFPEIKGLKVSAQGQGRLYYDADLTYFPRTARKRSLNRGYELTRSYQVSLPANATNSQLSALLSPRREDMAEAEYQELLQLRRRLTPLSHSFEVGDLVEVELRVKVEADGSYVVINDPLPAGLEIVDPVLNGAVQHPRSDAHSRWSVFDHIELRSDRVLLFADKLRAGQYSFRYLTRATTAGRFVRPAALIEEMYNPHRAGRSDGGYIWIRSTSKAP